LQADRPISLANAEKKQKRNFSVRSVRGGYYIALSYEVIRDAFVWFTFAQAKAEVICFETLVSAKEQVTQ